MVLAFIFLIGIWSVLLLHSGLSSVGVKERMHVHFGGHCICRLENFAQPSGFIFWASHKLRAEVFTGAFPVFVIFSL